MTVGNMCANWGLDRRDLLALAERWGARAVRDEYRARLSAGLVDEEAAFGAGLAAEHGGGGSVGGDSLPADKSRAVDRAVARAVEVVGRHKVEIGAARSIVVALLDQLRDSPGDLTLPQRAAAADKLLSAYAKAVAIERQAHQIADEPGDGGKEHVPLEERLRKYAKHGLPAPKP